MPPTRRPIFVVDDDEAVRGALSSLFDAEGYEPHEFDSAEAFLASGMETSFGCAIIDIQMPGMSGLDLQQELIRRGAAVPVIVLTSHGDVAKAVRALKAGAVDFIEKPFNVGALLTAVREALERPGGKISPAEFDERRATLTNRECEVMDLVVAGHPNKVVAAKLGISVRTAEVHRAKVMEKMGCNNLSALIHLALARTGA
jgi:FixJ family two-component response regulator